MAAWGLIFFVLSCLKVESEANTQVTPSGDSKNFNPAMLYIDFCYPASLLTEGEYYCKDAEFSYSHSRCDDDIGYLKDGLNLKETQDAYFYIGSKTTKKWYGPCYTYKDGAFIQTSYKQTSYNYAWKTQAACNPNICNPGEQFGGCMRYSPGTCTPCTGLLAGNYWSVRGQCIQAPCEIAQPGFHYTSRCGTTSNAVLAPCAKHIGNTEAPVPATSLATAKYFCPGGDPDVLDVPDNAHVSDDYTSFVCNDGYFRKAGSTYSKLNSCTKCELGSYCANGEMHQCPEHYYSSQIGQSFCKLCTKPQECDNSVLCDYNIVDIHQKGTSICGNVPQVCNAGSTQKSRCISCGTCGNWPYTGINCVLGDEMDSLPPQYPPQ